MVADDLPSQFDEDQVGGWTDRRESAVMSNNERICQNSQGKTKSPKVIIINDN